MASGKPSTLPPSSPSGRATGVSDAVLQIADKLGLSRDDKAIATIEKRIMPFLLEIQPGRQVEALHGGFTQLLLSPAGGTASAATSSVCLRRPRGMTVPTTAEVPSGANGLLQAKTFFAAPDGWGVISGALCCPPTGCRNFC